MTTLRKKIFHCKIQNTIVKNDFVLFFQFNNVKFKHWILLKNQISNFQNTNIIVIKNKIPYKIMFAKQAETLLNFPTDASKFLPEINVSKKSGNHINNLPNQIISNLSCDSSLGLNLQEKRKKLDFLCQGPTLMVAFNSINQCKAIYEILNEFTYNFSCNKLQLKPEFLNLHKCKKSCFDNTNLPLLFLKNKAKNDLRKSNFIKNKNIKSSFFFMGGFIQGKAINHLDFEKLLQLNSSVFVDFIRQYSNPIVSIMFLNTIIKIKLMKCFQNNLVSLLNLYKHDLKKIAV